MLTSLLTRSDTKGNALINIGEKEQDIAIVISLLDNVSGKKAK